MEFEYRGWNITYSDKRPVTEAVEANADGVKIFAPNRAEVERMVDQRLRDSIGTTFGEYFQSVMSNLVSIYEWDDPYHSITPAYHDGRWIDIILNGYLTKQTTEETAALISEN